MQCPPSLRRLDVGGAETAARRPPLRLVTVVKNLRQPTYVAATTSEPGRLYVAERRGVVRVIESGRLRRTPFLNIRAAVRTAGEGGLLSIAFHPQYATNRRLYAAYTNRALRLWLGFSGVKGLPQMLERLRVDPHHVFL